MFINIIMPILLIIATIASIVAWLNTQTILKEISLIKDKLGIIDEKKPSFFNRDLDND